MMIYTSLFILSILIAFIAYRQYSISKLSYSKSLEQLRRSRKLYWSMSENEKQSTYGRYLKKSIDYLQKKVNAKK